MDPRPASGTPPDAVLLARGWWLGGPLGRRGVELADGSDRTSGTPSRVAWPGPAGSHPGPDCWLGTDTGPSSRSRPFPGPAPSRPPTLCESARDAAVAESNPKTRQD